jgi:hypothetical protein
MIEGDSLMMQDFLMITNLGGDSITMRADAFLHHLTLV